MKKEIRDRHNIFWLLATGVVISLGLYVFFVSHTVWSAVERQNAEKSITAIEGDLEKLETTYFNLKNKITAELAKSKGFTDVLSSTFVSRKPLGKGLSLNNEI